MPWELSKEDLILLCFGSRLVHSFEDLVDWKSDYSLLVFLFAQNLLFDNHGDIFAVVETQKRWQSSENKVRRFGRVGASFALTTVTYI